MIRLTIDPVALEELHQVYLLSMKVIWWTGLGTSIIGFLTVWLEQSYVLRDSLETDYGLQPETLEIQQDTSPESEHSKI